MEQRSISFIFVAEKKIYSMDKTSKKQQQHDVRELEY